MQRITKASSWIAVFGFIFLIFAVSGMAQKTRGGLVGPLAEDTAINPHDFISEYYELNGIAAKAIIGRRTGSDGLSVFGLSSNPFHTNVRVIATIPAYDQEGGLNFWYPLGEVDYYGFLDDAKGFEMREIAKMYPLYVFPHRKLDDPRLFVNTRQAALMDNSWSTICDWDYNPLGFRQIFYVTYTDKAFSDDGREMMDFMEKKNGRSADETPIIRSTDDLRMLADDGMINVMTSKTIGGRFAIAPLIKDPTKGVIAPDAFLLFATKDGQPLPREQMFAHQFSCLQKTGDWCKE